MHDTFEDFNYRGFAKAIEREAYELAAYQCDLVVERARLIELMQHMDCAASLARTIRALINEPSKERNIQ
ncbi:hypothetical protein [Caballeronia calidae]|nr:hypothetical protein [Caballeronia calidae]